MFSCRIRLDTVHLSMVINLHLFGLQKVGYTELMFGLSLHFQVIIIHGNRQMERAVDGFAGNVRIQINARHIDAVIYAVGQVQPYLTVDTIGLQS